MTIKFPTRSLAARHAQRRGWKAFECIQIATGEEPTWEVEERDFGPGMEFAILWASDKEWVHHIEITLKAIPHIIATCFIEEITEDIPDLFKIRPVTPELWAVERRKRESAPKPTPSGRNAPAALRVNVDPTEAARLLLTPVAMSPMDLAMQLLLKK